jgi:hypothetical protein
MAKVIKSNELAELLVDAGIIEGPLEAVRRIVIDIHAERLPVMFVEYMVDDRVLEVVQRLEGIEVKHA